MGQSIGIGIGKYRLKFLVSVSVFFNRYPTARYRFGNIRKCEQTKKPKTGGRPRSMHTLETFGENTETFEQKIIPKRIILLKCPNSFDSVFFFAQGDSVILLLKCFSCLQMSPKCALTAAYLQFWASLFARIFEYSLTTLDAVPMRG